jgi:hypothetical protein
MTCGAAQSDKASLLFFFLKSYRQGEEALKQKRMQGVIILERKWYIIKDGF